MTSWKSILGLLSLLMASGALADRVPPGNDDAIAERLAPFGEVCRSGEECAQAVAGNGAGAEGTMGGEQVYNQFCNACHSAGVAGAPVLGDPQVWQPRIAKGMDTLWEHTLNGFNAMPAKGTCMNCSDEELRAALDYMVEQAQ